MDEIVARTSADSQGNRKNTAISGSSDCGGEIIKAAETIQTALSRVRIRHATEVELHQSLSMIFAELGLPVTHEYELDRRSRIDFFVPGIGLGIECKIKGSPSDILRQCIRYCDYTQINGLVLITSRLLARLPSKLCDKPVWTVSLWKNAF